MRRVAASAALLLALGLGLPPADAGSYLGAPFACQNSCTINAGDFDTGGEGVGYHDTFHAATPLTRAGVTVNVDGADAISYLASGEWYEYTVATNGGAFALTYSVATSPPTTVPLKVVASASNSCTAGATAVYAAAALNTAGALRALPGDGVVTLPYGTSTIRVCFLTASYARFATLALAPRYSSPFGGVPQTVPGTVSAVAFDVGGQGVAYSVQSQAGEPLVRAGELVTGGGGSLGYLNGGEWYKYSVNVQAAATYNVAYMLAGNPPSAVPLSLYLTVDSGCGGTRVAAYATATFDSGTWATAKAYRGGAAALPSGRHVLTLCVETASYLNIMGVRLNQQAATSAPTVPPPGVTPAYKNWPLKWSDEFNGGTLDTTKWQYSIGNACDLGYCGWGNNEQQSYQPSAVYQKDGKVVLEARKEYSSDGSPYISGKIVSRAEKGFNVLYGRVEACINFPVGQGFWPSFWMLPDRYTAPGPYGNWPASGEIDIVEVINKVTGVHTSAHYGATWKHQFQTCQYNKPDGGSWGNDYHVYAVEWAPWGELKYYVDGQLTCTVNQWWSSGGAYVIPFNKPFYIILNFAVGGSWPGWVDTTLFANGQRHQALYDYVRVYSWPSSRRLGTDDDSVRFDVPDGWQVPPGWDMDANTWKPSHDETPPPTPLPIPAACTPTPFGRDSVSGSPSPWVLPPADGTGAELLIGAEYFDSGGQDCAYHDADPTINRGNSDLRRGAGVDLVSYNNATNGPYVGWMEPGEWLSYTVFVPTEGAWSVQVVATSPPGDGIFRIVMDSSNCASPEPAGGSVLVTNRRVSKTAATAWRFYGSDVAIPSGVHQLTLCDMAGTLNVDYLKFEAIPTASSSEFDAPVSHTYSGPVPVTCVSHSCHDGGIDVALTQRAEADGLDFEV